METCSGCGLEKPELADGVCARCWKLEVDRIKELTANKLKPGSPKTIFVETRIIGDQVGVQVTAPHLPQFVEDSMAKLAIDYLFALSEKQSG